MLLLSHWTWAWRVSSHTDATPQLSSVSTSTISPRSWSWLIHPTPSLYNASKTQALWRSLSRTQKLKDLQSSPLTWSPLMSSISLFQRPSIALSSPSTQASSRRSARSSNHFLNPSPSWLLLTACNYPLMAQSDLDSLKFNQTKEIEKRSKLWSKSRSQWANNLLWTT